MSCTHELQRRGAAGAFFIDVVSEQYTNTSTASAHDPTAQPAINQDSVSLQPIDPKTAALVIPALRL